MKILNKTIAVILFFCLVIIAGCDKHKEKKYITIVRTVWTGVSIKSAITSRILRVLGYETEEKIVSVPLAYRALSLGEADFFMGNWMPSMKEIAEPYFKTRKVVRYSLNMKGAWYTLAVPAYVARAGLRNFRDIHKYRNRLRGEIYGIEEGNDGNEIIKKMIRENLYNLKGFRLIASSEAGMLARVKRAVKKREWIVFLGWAPHPMNRHVDMTPLKGSTEETFGPNNGEACVYTNIRQGFVQDFPNAARMLANLDFPVPMMTDIMDSMQKNSIHPEEAAMLWLKANPSVIKKWLNGVKTLGNLSGEKAFRDYLAEWEN